ncbi:LPXTG cell wall anchor domain-containing protein [Streptococcus pluranimalium]|uniref:LPXTG cell wall anchor domain-containing protein n=1 Tax=Streptococcus pluranimalium TaxID=82348 RepID=UPI003F68E1CD
MSDQSQSQAKTELTDRKSQKDLPKTGSESSTTGFWSGILTLVAGLAIVRKNKKSE